MEYRNLGSSGLRVSVFSLGSWITFGNQQQLDDIVESISLAYGNGVNFFDNSENYAGGESERLMGEALRRLGLPRYSYVLTSKFYFGIHPAGTVNMRETLNRKYLMQAVEASLRRWGFDFLDVIFCHRFDPSTPLEEIVRAMNDLIVQGKALYWGTSEWSADQIRAAWDLADRNHWHKPITEQSQYHLLRRRRVECEYQWLYRDIGLGLTAYSPLARGLLTGKYLDGVPENSRLELAFPPAAKAGLDSREHDEGLRRLKAFAEEELGMDLTELALAWCASNRNVSSVIVGASCPEQVKKNVRVSDLLSKMTPEVREKVSGLIVPE